MGWLLSAVPALWQWVPAEVRGKLVSAVWSFITRRMAYRRGRKDQKAADELADRERNDDLARKANDARKDVSPLDRDALLNELRDNGNLRD